MLKPGDPVAHFQGEASNGQTIALKSLVGQPFIAYFFPKSFTPGCTIETQRFASLYPEFQELGVEVVGISSDDVETQCDFAQEMSASFPIMADPKGLVYKAFDMPTLKLFRRARRVTFFIDEEGRVEKVFSVGFNFHGHPQDMLDYCKQRLSS